MFHTENFLKTFRIIGFCLKLLGLNVFVLKYETNLMTYTVIIMLITFYGFNINTIIRNSSDDWGILYECGCTFGGGLMGFMKIFSAIAYHKEYYQMYFTLLDIYKEYEPKGSRYEAAMRKCSQQLYFIIRIVGVVYLQLVVVGAGLTILFSILNGKRYYLLQIYIPGLDTETEFGYWFLFVFLMICLLIAGFGLFAGDLFILTSLTHSVLFVDIFENKILELNEIVDNILSDQTDQTAQELLNDIVRWHQKYLDFTKHCNKIFNSVITVQVFSATFSIVLSLFIIMTRDWPGSYAYLLFAINSLYEYCLMGTQIEICNDRFCDEIYKIHWYNLTVSQQKMVMIMLNRSQSPTTITIAGVLPLSVNTGLAITRNIYSVVMMMIQFN